MTTQRQPRPDRDGALREYLGTLLAYCITAARFPASYGESPIYPGVISDELRRVDSLLWRTRGHATILGAYVALENYAWCAAIGAVQPSSCTE